MTEPNSSSSRRGTGGPARGYSWPPFAKGHTLSLRHGAYSERTWAPVAEHLITELRAIAPWTASPGFDPTVRAWARAEARAHLILQWLGEHGDIDEDGKPRAAVGFQLELEREARRLRAELGLAPLALAKILGALTPLVGSIDGDALKALRAEGARILEQRREQLAAGEDKDAS